MCRADTVVGIRVVDADGREASLGRGDPEESTFIVAQFAELGEDYQRAGETLAECPERQARAVVHGLLRALAEATLSHEPVLVIRAEWDGEGDGSLRWVTEEA